MSGRGYGRLSDQTYSIWQNSSLPEQMDERRSKRTVKTVGLIYSLTRVCPVPCQPTTNSRHFRHLPKVLAEPRHLPFVKVLQKYCLATSQMPSSRPVGVD